VEAIVAAFSSHCPTSPRPRTDDVLAATPASTCCYCNLPSRHACTMCGAGNAHPHCTQLFCPSLFGAPGGGRVAPEPLCLDCAQERLGGLPEAELEAAHARFSQAKRRPGWQRAGLLVSLSKCLPLKDWQVFRLPSRSLLHFPCPTPTPPPSISSCRLSSTTSRTIKSMLSLTVNPFLII
jgi:hypothetical protein